MSNILFPQILSKKASY